MRRVRWGNDDRLFSPKKQIQAFLFHGRVEAADDRDTAVPHGSRYVVRLHDSLPRAPVRSIRVVNPERSILRLCDRLDAGVPLPYTYL